MPRILGVDIPNDKRTVISLRYIYGIGPFLAAQLCERASVDPDKRARELTEDDLAKLATLLDNEYVVEGQLRRQVQQNIARLRDIGCYRGLRHRKGLPVHAYDSVICALWSRRDGMTELYVSNEGSFTVVPRGFFCAGAGKFTADYVIGAEGGFGVLTPELRSAAAAFRQMFYDQKGAFTTKRFEESLKGARFRYQKVLDILAEKPSHDTLTRTLGALRELEKPKGPR